MKRNVRKILIWSQKYTKTDMLYLAKGGSWLGLGQIFSIISTLALSYVFANFMSQETYGVYKYVLSISALFLLFTLPGMQTALSRACAKGYESLIHPVTALRVKFALIGSLVALCGSLYYYSNGNLQLTFALLIIAASLPIYGTFTTYLSYLSGKRRFKEHTKLKGIAQTVSFVSLVVATIFTDNLIYILVAYFFPIALVRILIYIHISRTIPHKINVVEKKITFTYGKHLTAINILGIFASNLDKILLWKFFGPVQLAIYVFAMAIPDQLKGMLSKVGELAFPKFASQTSKQIGANLPILMHKVALYVLASFLLSIIYILVAPYIFQLLFPQYIESVFFSQIVVLSLFTSINVPLRKLLEAQKKTKAQYLLDTIRPLVLGGLFFFLIPPYGIMGAILAYMITRAVLTVLLLITIFLIFKKK